MKCGEECEIVEYKNSRDITIKFMKTEEKIRSNYNHFKKGTIKSHFSPSICGIGIVGGIRVEDECGELVNYYKIWYSMINRCYAKKSLQKRPTYKECTVCDEWIYYKNFKEWYEKNYYEIEGEKMCLDKDILVKGNKIYSPETCVFVPSNINTLFTKSDAKRGEYPIGVSWKKKNNKYQANCRIFDIKNNKYRYKYLGLYNTPEEAFKVYKKAKEENIKQVADYYKDQIPQKLYEAMYKYEVEITD